MPRHFIKNRRAEVCVGLAFGAAAALLLYDAYDKRGVPVPRILRPLTFW